VLKLLIPVNRFDASRHAIKRVIQRSWGREAVEPHLLYVLRSREEHGIEILDAAGEMLEGSGLSYVAHICYGDPAEQIVRFAERNRFAGIVMASSGLGSLSEMLLGSVTAQVLRTSRIPVEVVPVLPRSRLRAYVWPAGLGAGLGVLLYAAFG